MIRRACSGRKRRNADQDYASDLSDPSLTEMRNRRSVRPQLYRSVELDIPIRCCPAYFRLEILLRDFNSANAGMDDQTKFR